MHRLLRLFTAFTFSGYVSLDTGSNLIWIDLEDPELTNRALDLLKPALDARAGSVVWAFVAHDDSRALVLDPRRRQGSEPPARMGETFALELEARAVGAARSLGEVWEKGL